MNNIYRIIIAGLTLFIAVFMIWYFSNIVVYVIVSAVLSMIGHPLVKQFDKIQFWKFKMPHALSAGLTLITMVSALVGFVWIFVPIIASQAHIVSQIEIKEVITHFQDPINAVKDFLNQYNIISEEESIESLLQTQLESILSFATFSNFFSSLLSATGTIFIAVFSILFITFFFLKDEHMFENFILLISPTKHLEKIKHIILVTKNLLSRYFLGLLIEVISMMTLITIFLTILGIKNAFIIGFLGGLMNIIPYLGPVIGATIGVVFGLATALSQGLYDQISLFTLGVLGSFGAANLIDNLLLQPFIYSNSVKARPIEIFLVIIMAGSLAGIPGMILAIPGYTVMRITAKEFLSQSRIVQKLTDKI